MKKITTAIIGFGVVGKRRMKFIKKNKFYDLISISDIRFKKNFKKGKISYFKNYKEILNDKHIKAVFITLPNYLAAKVTKEFLNKKINVFCEKPPGKNPEELKSVINTEKKNRNIKLKYGFNHRYHDSIKLAKKYIDQNYFGKIINIRSVYGKSKIITFNKNDWRAKRKFAGGGILLDQGIHLLDLLTYFVGNFQFYKSFISNNFWKYDVEDNAFALMKNKKGVIASIHSTATQWQHKFMMEIIFEKCLMVLSGILSGTKSYGKESLVIFPRKDLDINKNKKTKKFFFNKDNSWKNEVDEFADIILKNRTVKTGNSNQALQVMNMVYKIYQNDKSWKFR